MISALLAFLNVAASSLNACATPLGRGKLHRGTLKEWLGASWDLIRIPAGLPAQEVSAAVAQSRFNQLRAALKLDESPEKLKCVLSMLHQVIGVGEELPIFTYNNPAFESSAHKNLRALVAPVSVELSSIDGGIMGTYQIEPLAKVEAVRKLILSSAPMNGPSTALYRTYCKELVGSKIVACVKLPSDKAFSYREATVEACAFVSEVPVHTLKLLPKSSPAKFASSKGGNRGIPETKEQMHQMQAALAIIEEAAAAAAKEETIQVVLTAIKYRILERNPGSSAEDECCDSSMEEDLEEEASYSVRVSLASASEQPTLWSVHIIKPEWYDVKDFWQAIRHGLMKALLAGGYSWQDRGWSDERECVMFCNKEIVEKFKGCVAKNLLKEQVTILRDDTTVD